MRAFALLALCLAARYPLTQAGAAPKRLPADFRKDQRFQHRQVPLSVRRGELKALAAAIGTATQVPLVEYELVTLVVRPPDGNLVLQPGLGARPIAAGVGNVAAVELMEAMEVALMARWRPARGNWVLTTIPGIEELCVLTDLELNRRWIASARHATTLTPSQRELLAQRGTLYPTDLNANQRGWLAENVKAAYVYYAPDIAPESLQLKGVYFRLRPLPDESLPMLDMIYPQSDGEPDHSFMRIEERELRVDPRGPPPPPAPPRESKFATRSGTPPQPAVLKEDPRLDATVRLTRRGLLEAAMQAAEAAKVSILICTEYDRRPFLLRGQGVRFDEFKAAEVLEAIAEIAGGEWVTVGSLYVLKPNPTLERLALLEPHYRKGLLADAAAVLIRHLTTPQRRLLRAGEKLTPESMTSEQRRAWKWIAGLGFAATNYVSRGSLELKGAVIDAVRAPGAVGGAADALQARFLFRSNTGVSMLITSVPLGHN